MATSLSFAITEPSQVGEARRAAHRIAQQLGFGEAELGTLNIIATELGTNLHKHARQGEMIVRPLHSRGGVGVEFLSVDRGPGMADVNRCLEDGFSTVGTRGQGLGSVKRMSTVFDVYSGPQGSVLVSQLWLNAGQNAQDIEVGAVCLPYPGETACGDDWAVGGTVAAPSVIMADGLGHGVEAAAAAAQATAMFSEASHESPQICLQRIHGALRATRGAAVFVLQAGIATRKIVCSGIGNISAACVRGEETKSFVSLNGTLGHQASRFQEFVYDWPQGALIVSHSDGLLSRWKLSAYPGLQARHPSLAAAILYRDFRRGRDDVTVFIMREGTRRTST